MTEVVIKQSITPSEWLQVPQESRNKLRKIFNIKPSGSSHVIAGSNGKSYVTSDGFTPQDLLGITLLKLQEYCGLVGSTAKDANDIHIMFQEAVIRVEQPEGTINTLVDDTFKRSETPAFTHAVGSNPSVIKENTSVGVTSAQAPQVSAPQPQIVPLTTKPKKNAKVKKEDSNIA